MRVRGPLAPRGALSPAPPERSNEPLDPHVTATATRPKARSRRSTPAAPALAIDPAAARALAAGTVGDPFQLLGPQRDADGTVVRVYLPPAEAVDLLDAGSGEPLAALQPLQEPGLFAAWVPGSPRYRLRIRWPGGTVEETEDPYAFGLLLGELDLHLISEGCHHELARCLGAQVMSVDGIPGVRFAVWAPNARRVSVVGDFNARDGRRHPMRLRAGTGVWELFIPRLRAGTTYQFEILGRHGEHPLPLKADPVARQCEPAPRSGSIVASPEEFVWTDQAWLAQRASRQAVSAPLSIYEVHAPSWRRHDDGRPLDWDALGDTLIPYVRDMGFTHLELLPIMAHPFGGSWGYQPLGLYAPQAALGEPAAFARFVDRCHAQDLGVILDWVPAHFPTDAHGLVRFDGTALYEHEDPREGFHQDWNTLIFNLGRREVRGFVIGSALHWLERFHVDGLRVDAVASMLYRDYSRRPGEWLPNHLGGRENLESIDFLRQLNAVIATRHPGVMVIAEESTAFPGVSHGVDDGGLGFSYKWNMGWMHDSLAYMAQDPIHRRWHHDRMTFGLLYAFAERFVLPISHDEVVHGKGSLLRKMPGDRWQKFANLRAYLSLLWTHPGKKLLFMGSEFAQDAEWNHDTQLDWAALRDPLHGGAQQLVRDLNRLFVREPALHEADDRPQGFRWVIADDRDNSVFAFVRQSASGEALLVVCNFTPVPQFNYRVGVPRAGTWHELLNSDAAIYGGSNLGNGGAVYAQAQAAHGLCASVELCLPPLGTLILRPGESL